MDGNCEAYEADGKKVERGDAKVRTTGVVVITFEGYIEHVHVGW
jgi:hypothetical protein